jgi:cardiolipin synthase
MKHIPNILTIFRIILVPVFLIIYFSNFQDHSLWALFIFLLAGFTDFLDGYLARKYNVTSKVGTVLDPFADKLMLLTALTSLYIDNLLPLFILIIMYLKECTMVILGIFMFFKKTQVVIPANIFGKLATFMFTIAVVITFIFPTGYFHIILLIIALTFKLVAFSSYVRHYLVNHSKKFSI